MTEFRATQDYNRSKDTVLNSGVESPSRGGPTTVGVSAFGGEARIPSIGPPFTSSVMHAPKVHMDASFTPRDGGGQ
jgi:hypothetical protein